MRQDNNYRVWFTPFRRRLVLVLFFVALPPIFYGMYRSILTNENRIEDWLPEGFQETEDLTWLRKNFDDRSIIGVSWEGAELDENLESKDINRFAEALSKVGTKDNKRYFERIWTSTDFLEQLPEDMPRNERIANMRGWLLGRDGKTTCAVCLVSAVGYKHRHDLVRQIFATGQKVLSLPPEKMHVAGGLVDSVAIDEASHENMLLYSGICFLALLGTLWFCFKSLRVALLCFMIAGVSEALSLALLFYAGTNMDSVSMLMATLVFVLGISGAIHLTHYYTDALQSGGVEGAAERAAHTGLTPCFLAAFTTVIGVGSLAISKVVPIVKFGTFSAIAIGLGFVLLFLVLPSSLAEFPAPSLATASKRRRGSLGGWKHMLRFVAKGRFAIIAVTVFLLAVTGYGVTQIQTSVRLHDLFRPGAKILQDYDWIESNVGALTPVDLVIRIPIDKDAKNNDWVFEGAYLASRVRHAAESLDEIEATISVDQFCRHIPYGDSNDDIVQRGIMKDLFGKMKTKVIDGFTKAGYFRELPNERLWRITLRAKSNSEVDYAKLMKEIPKVIAPVLKEHGIDPEKQIVLTGGVPVVQKAQEQLLEDLIESFLLAFVLVAIVMIILLRGIRAGLLVMIPNLLPCMVVFGAMGLSGRPINMGTMMTASVAIGIAVDGTLHFVTWFRRGLALGRNRVRSVALAYSRCASAMSETTVVCGLGMIVFVLSPFAPVALFSWFMALLLLAALIGDLVVLPALLLSPLGKVFLKKQPEKQLSNNALPDR